MEDSQVVESSNGSPAISVVVTTTGARVSRCDLGLQRDCLEARVMSVKEVTVCLYPCWCRIAKPCLRRDAELWHLSLERTFSYCSREVKMELFRSHCYSIYYNSLWSRFKVATLNRLKVCHNDILKRLLGLPRWCSSSLAFARNGVNNLDVIRRHSVFSLWSRVELSSNSIITSVRQSSAYVCGPIQQRWLGLLFGQIVG
ncbi:hypothetical protein GWK47_033044 [Chionoecetes opilio]|uniref:Uncharacterized protein n=1 Tax=Chionoecetes opilio TaxID=41210 RepID=A0A8J4YPV5_CHIOP|nr:hypothetical protein GWK47_033044 [Chionoecetes opilio]